MKRSSLWHLPGGVLVAWVLSCPCLVGLVLGISSPNSWTQQPHEPLGIACLIPGMRGSGCWVGSEMTTNGHDQQPNPGPQDRFTNTTHFLGYLRTDSISPGLTVMLD